MKKLLLALCVMLALLLGVAAAENTGLEAGVYDRTSEEYKHIVPEHFGNYWYIILKDGTAEIVKYSGNDKILTIPSKLNGISISSVAYGTFGFEQFEEVVIPDGVTTIGEYAFNNCYHLTDVVIPDSVTTIGEGTFLSCYHLTDVVIPESVTTIGPAAFYGCSSLTDVIIPDGVTTIGTFAFEGCTALTDVIIPDGVTTIGTFAFEGCTSLTDVIIPDGVTIIEKNAFEECTSLKNVTIPASVTTIGTSAFEGCTSLTDVIIEDGVTTIEAGAFKECTSLKNVTIPASVTSMGEYSLEFTDDLVLHVVPYSYAEQVAIDEEIPYEYITVDTWTCPECQNYNETDFCIECGTQQPEPTATPAPTPVYDGSWDCTCGSHNFGKFCGSCGAKRPDPRLCPNGHAEENPNVTFCTECGEKFE